MTFQRYVIIDAQRPWTGSIKVKIDLCQGKFLPKAMTVCHDLLLVRQFLISDYCMWLFKVSEFVSPSHRPPLGLSGLVYNRFCPPLKLKITS